MYWKRFQGPHPPASGPSMPYGFDLHPEILAPGATSTDTEVDPDLPGNGDLHLLEYVKERAVTWGGLEK